MQLPPQLTSAIAEATRDIAGTELTRASAELTAEYRGKRKARPQLDRAHRAAYLLTRLPATYAVLSRIFAEVRLSIPELQIESMLDLGAGPGTAMWAAAERFSELRDVTIVDDSMEWNCVGKKLARNSVSTAISSAIWKQGSIGDELPSGNFDLVAMSYVVNELRSSEMIRAVQSAWQHTRKLLVIAEPGTPTGFGHIKEIRRELLASGAHIAAPCPHENECPMAAGDWCHFAERVQRSSEHRVAKGGELGYEDEKYSYVVFTRSPIQLPAARILRHPRKHSGHLELVLCAGEGLREQTVSRKQGEKYKVAKNAKWGDAFE